MSPVTVGSRLDQLYGLLARTRQELMVAKTRQSPDLARLTVLEGRVERAITAAGGIVPAGAAKGRPLTRREKAQRKAAARISAVLIDLDVTQHDIKIWAVSQGLLARVKRGPVKVEIVEAYAASRRAGGAA